MKKLLASFVILFLAGVLLFVAQGKSLSEKTLYSGKAVISMTDHGFTPQEISVTKGTEVRFVNESEVRRWPASDLHPTHTIYAAFDPKGPIAPGEEWSFVFEKTGTWNMHDHLAPYFTGKVIVVE